MHDMMLFLHLLTAVFAIGPLAHAATTAARGLRTGDATAVATSARTVLIYAYASLLVVVFGFGLMSADDPHHPGEKVAEFTDPFIWISLLLWVIAVALALGVIVPTLRKAGVRIGAGEPVEALSGRVAASGGLVALIFLAIVALMVYRPGS